MLPKKLRLTAAEVRQVLQSGKSAREGVIAVKWLKAPTTKAAAVVSKKVAKSAVARNRLRRAVYSALQPLLPSLSPTHAVFFVQKQIETQELTDDIKTLCLKLS